MARPQMDSRVEGQSPTSSQSCRMEVLRRDAWPSGNTHSALQPRHRHRTMGTQTSPIPQLAAPTQDALIPPSSPQQDEPLGDNTGRANNSACPICTTLVQFSCQVQVASVFQFTFIINQKTHFSSSCYVILFDFYFVSQTTHLKKTKI